ncbi:MAG: hypothetical protein LBM61_04750 [Prevotellaceae bacterium]|jgi:tetratricopeptide (TPR) repeat protein|nr:hypothetical protein [Prevotellaceae bacterium]
MREYFDHFFHSSDDGEEELNTALLLQLEETNRLLEANRSDEAKNLLTSIDDEEFDDDPAMMVLACSLYNRLGMSEHAYRWVKRRITPLDTVEEPLLADILAECYSILGKYDEAIKYYDEQLDEDPYNCEYWLFLAETYCRCEMYDKALEACDFAHVSDEKDEYGADIHYIRAVCFEAMGDKERAFAEYKKSAYLGKYYR